MPKSYAFYSCMRQSLLAKKPESFVTGSPCRVFGALARRGSGIDMLHRDGHSKLRAKYTAVTLKIVGGSLQAVVNMQGCNLAGPLFSAGHQQCAGVGTAAECHTQRQLRIERRHGTCNRRVGGLQVSVSHDQT